MVQWFLRFNARWPAFRTTRQANPSTRRRAAILGAVGACVVPLAVGLVLLGLSVLFETEAQSNLYETLWGLGFILVMSPVLSVIAFIPACVMSLIAMKFGCAGWMTAMSAGALIATVIFSNLSMQGSPVVVGWIFGALFGAVFWLSARLSTPHAFWEPSGGAFDR